MVDYEGREALYVHADGEGYMISEPCHIEISWADQVYMNLNKVSVPTSKYLSDILTVLNNAVADAAISEEQKAHLYERFVKNL